MGVIVQTIDGGFLCGMFASDPGEHVTMTENNHTTIIMRGKPSGYP